MWATALALASEPGGIHQKADQEAAVVLHASAPFSTLVRLTVGTADSAPSGAAIARAALPPGSGPCEDCNDGQYDEEAAATAAQLASRARSEALARRLHDNVRAAPQGGHGELQIGRMPHACRPHAAVDDMRLRRSPIPQ